MPKINKLITNIISPNLSQAARQSAERMRHFREDNVFHSHVLQELLTDKFEYTGNKPYTLFVKNRKTGEPVEMSVKVTKEKDRVCKNLLREVYQLIDNENQNLIGTKDFYIKKLENGSYRMYQGFMANDNPNYAGVGVRLDQMQIERALQLGIECIPRTSYPESLIYHTKMGFLPLEKYLEPVRNMTQLKNYLYKDFKPYEQDIPLNYFNPVVVEKEGNFFIDKNKTLAYASMQKSRDILQKSGHHRIVDLSYVPVYLALAGEELERWKNIIKNHPLLSKWN